MQGGLTMAKFRQVHTTFWQDPRVLEEMTPEDRYFYLYLLTNPNTTQIGVYQITRKQMAFDLGYSVESVNSLLERFITHHKLIKYNDKTREIALLNWGKYNLSRSGKPVIDCVTKELSEVKDKTLIWEIMNKTTNDTMVKLFSRYVYDTSHDTSTIGGQEEQQEEEKEKQQEQNAFAFFENNFGVLNPFVSQSIEGWINDLGEVVVIEAMKRALKQQKKWNYAEGILKQWVNNNIKTLQDVLVSDKQFKQKQEPSTPKRNDKHLDYMRQLRGEAHGS